MPPPLHVCDGLASPADAVCRVYCEMCEVIRYMQHRFDVDSNFMSLYSWYNFCQNVISLSIGGSDYLPQISLKSVQLSSEAKMSTLA